MRTILAGLCLLLAACSDQGGARRMPLLRAVLDRDHAAVERLARDRSLLQQTDRYARTPLIIAAGQKDLQSVQLLLAAGADPNWHVAERRSPLTEAAGRPGNRAVIAALLWRQERTRIAPVARAASVVV